MSAREPGAIGWSTEARLELQARGADFLEDCTDLAERLSRRAGLDGVSVAHVRRAQELLERGGRRESFAQALTTIGGAMVGAGLSLWATLMVDNRLFGFGSAIFATAMLVIGAVLIALAFRI